MSDEAGTSCEVATCGMSISADGAHVHIYLGGAETDKIRLFAKRMEHPRAGRWPAGHRDTA